MLTIRPATASDIQVITDITNHAILHTTAIWTVTPVTAAIRGQWMKERLDRGLPVVVAEFDGRVAGFGSYGDFRPHEGYRHTVEHSLYVAGHAQGQGAGKALLAHLMAHARDNDKHVMVAGIDATNEASIALHTKAGFETTGRMPQVGRKFDRWLDLLLMQKILDAPELH